MEILQIYKETYPSENCRHFPCPFIEEIMEKDNKVGFLLYPIRATWELNITKWSNRELTCRLCAMEKVVRSIINEEDDHKYRNTNIMEFTRFYVHCLNTYQLRYGQHPTQNRWTRFIKSFRKPYKIDEPLEW